MEEEHEVQVDAASAKAELDELEELRAQLETMQAEVSKAKEQAESTTNRMKYLMADFDNYRKQMEKQLAGRIETIKAELLLKFVNVRDDYIRALSVARQSKSEPVVIEGLEGILKNIDSLLASEGVIEIESVGTPFDPNIHDAIAYTEKSDAPENTVTSEIRRGYMFNTKVLRPTLVEISKKPQQPETPPA